MKSVRSQRVLDVQWSDAPKDVIEEVRQLWKDHHNLGNDNSIYKFNSENWTWDSKHPEWSAEDGVYPTSYPNIENWLIKNEVPIGEEVWIHYWW